MNKYLLISALLAFAGPAYADVESFVKAAKENNIEQIQTLLKAGEDVNAKNSLGNTALHYAVANGNPDAIKVLLENGADVNIANEKGWTPQAIAEKKNFGEIVTMLQSHQDNKDLSALVEKASADAKKATDKVVEVKNDALAKTENLKAEAKADVNKVKADISNKINDAQEKIEAKTAKAAQDVKNAENKAVDATKNAVAAVATTTSSDNTAPKADKKEAEPVKAEQKMEEKSTVKSAPARVIKPVSAKPAPKFLASSIDKSIYAGDEEIVYCLYYLGLQTDQHNLTLAAEFFAGTTDINKVRFEQIADLAHKYYDNASEAEAQSRANVCSKIITPQNNAKQNQIIRAMNKAIGY